MRKFVAFFYKKVVGNNIDPGEVVNVRIALTSIYTRKFERIGELEEHLNVNTGGITVKIWYLCQIMTSYQRNQKTVVSEMELKY